MSSIGTPSSEATICANAVSWPWPCEVSPVETSTLPLPSTCTCPPSYGPGPVPSTYIAMPTPRILPRAAASARSVSAYDQPTSVFSLSISPG